jgi:hypothetical protein
MPVPEIIIMGEQSSGKSSVVEGFVGQKFNFISDGIATKVHLFIFIPSCFLISPKVPLVLSLLSNANCAQPKWELRVDGNWKELPIAEIKQHVSYINGMTCCCYSTPSILFRILLYIFSFL